MLLRGACLALFVCRSRVRESVELQRGERFRQIVLFHLSVLLSCSVVPFRTETGGVEQLLSDDKAFSFLRAFRNEPSVPRVLLKLSLGLVSYTAMREF